MIILYLISFLSTVFLPDLYIVPIWKWYRKTKLNISVENKDLYILPKHLGWAERALSWIILIFFPSQFVVFLGIWLALKTTGSFKDWGNGHEGRGKFMVFVICSVFSIISVLVFVFLTQFFVLYYQ